MVVKVVVRKGNPDSFRQMLIETSSDVLISKLQDCENYNDVSEILKSHKGEFEEIKKGEADITVDISKYMESSHKKMLKAFGSKK